MGRKPPVACFPFPDETRLMPNSRSAKKRLRQSQVRRSANRSIKSAMRLQIRKVRAAVQSGDIETAETAYTRAQIKLDRAGADRVIHPNAAARAKSRLQRLIKTAKAAS